jgi:hypothetical protein
MRRPLQPAVEMASDADLRSAAKHRRRYPVLWGLILDVEKKQYRNDLSIKDVYNTVMTLAADPVSVYDSSGSLFEPMRLVTR